MNRVIKFRAWFKPNDYGEPESAKPCRMIYFDEIGYCDEYNLLSFGLTEKSRDPEGGDYCNLGANILDFESVMQYTGLSDKNGVEIYEGDIVDCGPDSGLAPNILVLEWYGNGFYLSPDGKGFCHGAINEQCKVIGNIHENPELIEKLDGGTK